MSTGSSCGKVILLGEHSVVYGRPALAVGIDRGARVEFEPDGASREIELAVPAWNVVARSNDGTDVGAALVALRDALGAAQLGGRGRAEIELPPGAGLGSSAALGVATARAIGESLRGRPLTTEETLAAAFAWERVFHGNPSGVDHTLATRGGAALYSRAEGYQPIDLRAPLRILVADTGERSRTKDMVESVARIHARRTAATEKTFDAIAALVRNGALALMADDLRGLGQLMDLDQALLASLLLSTARTEQLCALAREAGAFGAKLTGGGGGGCVIAIAPDAEDAVLAAWREARAPAFVAMVRPTAP